MEQTIWNTYTENTEAWKAMLIACENATETIDLENFIFEKDELGNHFIEVCTRKASLGVRVRFIWDAAGSFSFFSSSIVEELKNKGIELVFFKTLLPSIFTFHRYRSWYFRNHRRTMIIDGKTGFTGSVSISQRTEKWRDTNVELQGPVVKDMQDEFEKMWARAKGNKVSEGFAKKNDYEFQYITNTPLLRKHHLYRTIVEAIRNAKRNIYITTPYFVPTHRIARVLRLAAHRGVSVHILIPEKSDYPIVDLGARTFFHKLLKSGVRIYLYRGSLLHCKTIVIDDDWASVGTLNIDHISLLYNFEANIVTSNRQFVAELDAHFQKDIHNTEYITLEQWNNRYFLEKISTFCVKIIRIFL